MNVFILASCRNIALLPATLLVFKTLRVGFPTAPLHLTINTLSHDSWEKPVINATPSGTFVSFSETNHWEWIRHLVETETEPFFLCDTDIVFWDSIEKHPMFNAETKPYLAGRYMPEFNELLSGSYAQPRLHTSLMFIEPIALREQIGFYQRGIPKTWFTEPPDLFKPLFVPEVGRRFTVHNRFYDTASMLYHAVSGFRFDQDMLNRYDHLHGACSADLMEQHGYKDKVAHDKAVFDNPELIRGSWREHDKYFASRAR